MCMCVYWSVCAFVCGWMCLCVACVSSRVVHGNLQPFTCIHEPECYVSARFLGDACALRVYTLPATNLTTLRKRPNFTALAFPTPHTHHPQTTHPPHLGRSRNDKVWRTQIHIALVRRTAGSNIAFAPQQQQQSNSVSHHSATSRS